MRLHRSLIAVLSVVLAAATVSADEQAPVATSTENKQEDCPTCDGWFFGVAPQVGYVKFANRLHYPDRPPFRVRESGADYAGLLFGIGAEAGRNVGFGALMVQGSYERGTMDLTSFMARDAGGRIIFDDDVVDDAKYTEANVAAVLCLWEHVNVGAGYTWVNVRIDSRTESLGIVTEIDLETKYTGPFLLAGLSHAGKRWAFSGGAQWYPSVKRNDTSIFTSSRNFTQHDSSKGSGWGASAAARYRLTGLISPQVTVFYRKFHMDDTPFLSDREADIHIAEDATWMGATFALVFTF